MGCNSNVFIYTLLICFTSGTYSIVHDYITDNRNMICPPIVDDSIKKNFLNRIVACSFDGVDCTKYIIGFIKSIDIVSTILPNSSFNPSNGDGYIYGSGGVITIMVARNILTDLKNFDLYISMAYYIHNTLNGPASSNVTYYLNGESDPYLYRNSTSTWNVFNKRYTFTESEINFTLSASGKFMRFDDLCIYQVCKFGYIFNKTTGLCEGFNVLSTALKISRSGMSQSGLMDVYRSKDSKDSVGFWIAFENMGIYVFIQPLAFYGENVVLTYRFYSSQRITLRIFYENLDDNFTEFNSHQFQEETFENWFDIKSSVRIDKISQHIFNAEKEKKVFEECIATFGNEKCEIAKEFIKGVLDGCNNCFILRITFANPGAKINENPDFITYLTSFNVLLDDLKVCPNNLTSNQLRNGCNGCAAGFNFNIASGQCEDFNECTNLLHVCTGNNKVCQNTVGSYKCLCIDGWILDLLPPDVASAEHNAACRYNFFGNNSPTCRRNEIALIPKLDREYLISFDIGPYWFKTNISLIHFTDCYSIDGCNPILHVYIALNGKIRVLNKHESYEGGAINETVLTSIEISQVLNNSDNFYKYTIKLNKEIVTSKLKKDVQSYKDVKVYASCFKDLLSNFNLINGIKSNGILPVVIIPTDLNLEKVWIHANRFMKTQYSHNQINGNANINNETLGIWVLKEHMLVIFRQFEYYGGFINVSVKTYTSQSAFWDVFIINNFGGFVRKIPFNTTHNGFFTCDIVLEYDEIKNSKFNKEIKEDLRCDTYLKEVRKNDSYLLELLDNDLLIGFYINFDYQSKWKNIESSMYLFSVNVSLDGLKRCPNGWVLNTHGNGCVDYDECKSLNPPCSWKSSVCINTNGSYKCSCKEGWFLDGESCLDFDECKSLNPPCSWKNSVCINTNGGHNCSCKEGWFLDGESCLDYDECKSSKPPCSWINSECINTNGGYNCSCKEGWFLDGESCLDFDECKSLNPPCSWKNSVCINTNGKYNCSCKEGWFLNGESCLDYDECKRFNPPCSWKNSVCVNTNGSYICSCKEGWFLDGESCLDLQTVNTMQSVFEYKTKYIIIGAVLAAIMVVVAVVVWRIPNNKKKSLILENSNHFIYASSKEYYKVSPHEWKISYKNIIIVKKIGEGAFGNVFVGKINANVLAKTKYFSKSRSNSFANCQGVMKSSDADVAVKVLKDGANQSELYDFIEEINLMKETGYHKNIVSMIGFSSIKNSLCLIVEYMENGDLLQFLRNNRSKMSKKDGEPSSFIYTLEFQNDLEVKEKTKNEIQLMEFDFLTSNDLLRFAWQVASGMEYLSCLKLIHRDLAARNVLVGADKILKISDFGLTRKVNNYAYVGSKTRRLPIKWMSIEAIFDYTFTSCSDVWSYGIVLFEIVTLGGTPYPTIPNSELLTLLKSGYRMNRPENCSEQMYDVMLHCWNQDPSQRPTFTELREFFDQILSDGSFYVDMNIDEKNIYYNTDAFHSISSETKDQATKE